jgi:nitric oxide reductase subunit B
MGTTIGINTTILLASILYIIAKINPDFDCKSRQLQIGFSIFKVSFFVFWISLLLAGIKKSHWMYFTKDISFAEMQVSLYGYYCMFLFSGIGIFIGLCLIIIPLINELKKGYFTKLN